MLEKHMWFEELPSLSCPEPDARNPAGKKFFRLIDGDTVKCEDFWSHRKIWPHRAFSATECRARSVSIFENLEQCAQLRKLPLHAKKHIACITLTDEAGVVKRTGKQEGHYSWWRETRFDPIIHATLVPESQNHA